MKVCAVWTWVDAKRLVIPTIGYRGRPSVGDLPFSATIGPPVVVSPAATLRGGEKCGLG